MATHESENDQEIFTPNAGTSRRKFIQATSTLALSAALPGAFGARFANAAEPSSAFKPQLMPTSDEVWKSLVALNELGPRLTGNPSHVKYINRLESEMQEAKLQTSRDTFTFPRWEAKKWSLSATPKGGSRMDLPVAFYYPHSGETGPEGVTGPLVYVGKIISDGSGKADLSGDLTGKIAVVDYEIAPRDYNQWYKPWGFSEPGEGLDKYITSTIAVEMGLLTEYKKAGAAGVIVVWSNLSDGQANNQNMPFGRPLQGIPSLMVAHETGAKLRDLATAGATATLTLEADVFQKAPTDTLIATLPGTSDEVLIITTHTDGPNVVQENAGVGLVALARYFARLPKSSRKRTLVFALTTGHDTGAYVPNTQGIIDRHPELIKKSVASMAVEHLGCREWRDNSSLQYMATGKNELTYAMTNHQPLAKIMLTGAEGTAERRVAAVAPTSKGRYLGVGGALAATGMPTLGFYASPTYLNILAPDGCISKLSQPLMYGQIQAIAKVIHGMDEIPASEIAWLPPSPRRVRE